MVETIAANAVERGWAIGEKDEKSLGEARSDQVGKDLRRRQIRGEVGETEEKVKARRHCVLGGSLRGAVFFRSLALEFHAVREEIEAGGERYPGSHLRRAEMI